MIAELGMIGPFFDVETHRREERPESSWSPMGELLVAPGLADAEGAGVGCVGADVLGERVRAVHAALSAGAPGEVPMRVAASVAHLGLVARVLAPALGVQLFGAELSFDAADLYWQNRLGGPFPLSVVVQTGCGGADVSGSEFVGQLGEVMCARFSVPGATVSGNVASAINSAAQLVAGARPDLAESARAIADRWLADDRIEGGQLRAGPDFRRRSCCLIYQVTGSREAVCGDCVLG
ncbi:(2Fe-2S)-binding protein [Gordonia jinhuaensis]|uniref:Ferric siderophore reductase C-terminal domain-containing protein n=2 Tax=Gordonia jinhuaensis TaxID=1517702 RepID=A0A916WVK2_9ACTN|nr:hypothetical protein GCM10011489_22760 [Gordonia jinhuaensis]